MRLWTCVGLVGLAVATAAAAGGRAEAAATASPKAVAEAAPAKRPDFESLVITSGPTIFQGKYHFEIRSDGTCRGTLTLGFRQAEGTEHAEWPSEFRLSRSRLEALTKALMQADWLNAETRKGPPATDVAQVTFQLTRRGGRREATAWEWREGPYAELVRFAQSLYRQEYLWAQLHAGVHGRMGPVEASRTIRGHIEALRGEPARSELPVDIDCSRFVPWARELVRDYFGYGEEQVRGALAVLGYGGVTSEVEQIAKLRDDRSRGVRDAVATALAELAGADAVDWLVEMAPHSERARLELVRLGRAAHRAVLPIIRKGASAGDDLSVRLVRAYIDHWDRLPPPDPELVEAVRQGLATSTTFQDYYETFLRRAAEGEAARPSDSGRIASRRNALARADGSGADARFAREELPRLLEAMAAEWPSQGGRVLYRETVRRGPRMTVSRYNALFNEKMDRVEKEIRRGEWPEDLLDQWQKRAEKQGLGELFREARRSGSFEQFPFYSEMVRRRKGQVAKEFEHPGFREQHLGTLKRERLIELRVSGRTLWRYDIQTESTNQRYRVPWSIRLETPEKTVSYSAQTNTVLINPPHDDLQIAWDDPKENPFAFPFDRALYERLDATNETHVDTIMRGGRELLRVAKIADHGEAGPVGVVWYFDAETLEPVRKVSGLGTAIRTIREYAYQTLPGGARFLTSTCATVQRGVRLPPEVKQAVASGKRTIYDEQAIEGALFDAADATTVEYLEVEPDVPIDAAVFDFEIPDDATVIDNTRGAEHRGVTKRRPLGEAGRARGKGGEESVASLAEMGPGAQSGSRVPTAGHVAKTIAPGAPPPVAKSATAATAVGQAETARRAAPSWFALVVGVALLAVGLVLVLAIVTALLIARASKRRRPHNEQPTHNAVRRSQR